MPYALPLTVAAPLLIHGDCLDELPKLPADSVDAYVSDPPAGIAFMQSHGAKGAWDSFKNYEPRTRPGIKVHHGLLMLDMPAEDAGFVAFLYEHWVEVLRVLKPGAYAVAWALPKTSDLAGLAMRLAGFVMDNPLLHLFSSAMAKGANPGKKIDAMFGADREVVGPGINAAAKSRHAAKRAADGQYANTFLPAPEGPEITAPATDLAAKFEDFNSQIAPGFENWLVGQKPTEGATPPRLRELTGLDYAWSPRKLKTAKARRQVARDFHIVLSDLEPSESNWGEAVRMCAALQTIEGCEVWGGTWQRRSGRSLRPGHPNIEQLLVDGEVVGERERGKYSGAPIKTIAANCIAQGVGAYHIGACRIPRGDKAVFPDGVVSDSRGVYGDGDGMWGDRPRTGDDHPQDGYPKTVLLTPGGERCPAKALDDQSGILKTAVATKRNDANAFSSGTMTADNPTRPSPSHAGEPDAGCSKFYTNLPLDDPDLDPFLYTPKARKRHAGLRSDIENDHNTLKTVALMRWIIRLVCPVGGVILSTFGGSGTDAVAAIAEGMRIIIMERRRDYFELICSRTAAAIGSPSAAAEANEHAPKGGQLGLL